MRRGINSIGIKPNQYYTLAEVAELLKCTPESVRRYIRFGYLKAARVGLRWIISWAELKRFLERGTAGISKARALGVKGQ